MLIEVLRSRSMMVSRRVSDAFECSDAVHHIDNFRVIIIIIIIIIITNFYTGLKNPSVCNTVVLGVLSKIINK